jgi:superfamily II DNA or RNA helicase
MALYSLGERVRIVGGGEGAVIEVNTAVTPPSYRIFLSAFATPVVSEPDLEPVSERESDLGALLRLGRFGTANGFRYALTHRKLADQLTDTLFSYNSARIQIQAHQFKPLLKLLDSPYRRMLIADEVGLGKTIEAGIILSEFDLREGFERVLVVCPHALLHKWRDELDAKFGMRFDIWSTRQFRDWLADATRRGFADPTRAIVGLEGIRSAEISAELDAATFTFDMLIVDEAHHLRNDYTQSYALGESLTAAADVVLFLSATPLNLRNRDLFNLVHLLLPEVYTDEGAFDAQITPNRLLNGIIRLLRFGAPSVDIESAAMTVMEGPLRPVLQNSDRFTSMVARLREAPELKREERVAFQRLCMDMNTLEGVVTRTRKTDVAPFAVREPHAVHLEFSIAERQFYDAVTAFCAQRYGSDGGVGFGAVTYQRQVCSCIPAMREILESIELSGTMLLEDELEEVGESEGRGFSAEEHSLLHEAIRAGDAVGATDTKFDVFERLISSLVSKGIERVMVFSFFRRTIHYLLRRLSGEYRVGVIMGGMSLDERERVVDAFRHGEIQILCASEVGSEGLDFQFCNVLVNYDLPWNPMRVEQRIGRLDRYGQLHDKILIYNLFIDETVETRIFGRLFERIQLFEAAIGDLEAILGDTVSDLTRVAMDLKLSPQQQDAKSELLAQQLLHRKQLEEDLSRGKDALLSSEQYFLDQFDAIRLNRSYLTPEELANFTAEALDRHFHGARITQSGSRWWLRPTPRFAEYVRREIYGAGSDGRLHHGSHVTRPLSRLAMAAEAERGVPVTFRSDEGFDNRELELLSPQHPYIQALVKTARGESLNRLSCTKIEISATPEFPSDFYILSLFRLESTGLRTSRRVEAVLVPSLSGKPRLASSESLSHLLGSMTDSIDRTQPLPGNTVHAALLVSEQLIVDLVATEKATIESRQADLIRLRIASLQFAFDRKRDRLERLAASATNQAIRKLRRGELSNASARHEAQLEDLRNRGKVAMTYDLLAVALVTAT